MDAFLFIYPQYIVLDADGNEKTIKVRDGHAIQMANAKIEEIRQGFVDWLGRTPLRL